MQQALELEVDVLDQQLARFDLGKVQHLVDDSQQMLARSLDLGEIVALPRREVGLERQVGQTDDGVHGRADFVTHVGEKVRFQPRSLFRKPLGVTHLLDGGMLGGDVVDDPHDPFGAVVDIHRVAGQPRPEETAVPAHELLLPPMDPPAQDLQVGIAEGDGGGPLRTQDGSTLADHRAERPSA